MDLTRKQILVRAGLLVLGAYLVYSTVVFLGGVADYRAARAGMHEEAQKADTDLATLCEWDLKVYEAGTRMWSAVPIVGLAMPGVRERGRQELVDRIQDAKDVAASMERTEGTIQEWDRQLNELETRARQTR